MSETPERQELRRLLNAAMREAEFVGQGYVGDFPKVMAPIFAAFDTVTRERDEAMREVENWKRRGYEVRARQ